MASVLDDTVNQALNTQMANEVSHGGQTLTRLWDNLSAAITQNLVNNIGQPTVLNGQGDRMLNGTPTMAPGNAANANT